MSFINYHTKEINCKVVYYGPGLGGKTTNIQQVYDKTSGPRKGKLITLDSQNERTLFFDFLPLDLGEIRGFHTRFHLYTVPGQSFYEASRKLILRGVDGIIFVADSQIERMEANKESWGDLKKNLEFQGYDISKLPLVIQWNKRDLPNTSSVDEMKKELNVAPYMSYEAKAREGDGVFESLKAISKLILMNLKGNFPVS